MKQMEKKLAVVSTSQLVVLAVYKLQNGRWQLDIYIRPKSHRQRDKVPGKTSDATPLLVLYCYDYCGSDSWFGDQHVSTGPYRCQHVAK